MDAGDIVVVHEAGDVAESAYFSAPVVDSGAPAAANMALIGLGGSLFLGGGTAAVLFARRRNAA